MRVQPVPAVTLRSDELEVEVTPTKGCDIRQITSRRSGKSVLASTPWTPQPWSWSSDVHESVLNWMRAYPGGWQVLLPSAGIPTSGSGHPYHGEASVASWVYETTPDLIRAFLDCYTLPIRIERTILVSGNSVVMSERVRNTGCDQVDFFWNHHVAFGGDLLSEDAEIEISGGTVTVDPDFAVPSNALRPGAQGTWPYVTGMEGKDQDLRVPLWGASAFAYVSDLRTGHASIKRRDATLGVTLTWPVEQFPTCWLWQELEGVRDAPWFGRTRLISVEPSISFPGNGLDEAIAAGQPLVRLRPGETREAQIVLTVDVN